MNLQERQKRPTLRINGVRFIRSDKALVIVGGSRSHLYTLADKEGGRGHPEGRFLWSAKADVRRTRRLDTPLAL